MSVLTHSKIRTLAQEIKVCQFRLRQLTSVRPPDADRLKNLHYLFISLFFPCYISKYLGCKWHVFMLGLVPQPNEAYLLCAAHFSLVS